MTPLSYEEFFHRFNEICHWKPLDEIVFIDCPKCHNKARLIALLQHPTTKGEFKEINCPTCGEMYLGIKIVERPQ